MSEFKSQVRTSSPDLSDFVLPLLSVRTAREAAFTAIEEYLSTGNWVSDVLDRLFRSASLPSIERGLAMELSCGIVRRFATLDTILQKLVARPLEKVEPALLSILRLGVYQLIILDSIPQHAAVHETVELTKRLGRMRWSPFVNGVLRGATRLVTTSYDDKPSAWSVPVGKGRFRRLNEQVFSDPEREPAAYFAEAFSFPDWLTQRWSDRMAPSELFRLGEWFNQPTQLHLRINQLRTSRDELVRSFDSAGLKYHFIEGTDSLVIESGGPIEQLPGYEDGCFAVQDVSASRAAKLLSPTPGSRVWDVCAAPGGKTCHLAELMKNSGEIVATDIRPERIALIEQNVLRLGASIVTPRLIQEDGTRMPEGLFDAILVDVPCSNTGVLGKRPEARWRITAAGVSELTRVQERLLTDALSRLKPEGRIVYSTCSIEPKENGELVRRVLSVRDNFRLVEEHSYLPGAPNDGGYQALIESV